MTPGQLRAFLAVAETGSVRAAAESLVVSQPAVSAVLASLRRELGVALVEREGRGLRLTKSGVVLAGYAQTTARAARRGGQRCQGRSGPGSRDAPPGGGDDRRRNGSFRRYWLGSARIIHASTSASKWATAPGSGSCSPATASISPSAGARHPDRGWSRWPRGRTSSSWCRRPTRRSSAARSPRTVSSGRARPPHVARAGVGFGDEGHGRRASRRARAYAGDPHRRFERRDRRVGAGRARHRPPVA